MINTGGKDFQAAQMFSTVAVANGANYIALTANATAPAYADTALTGEFVAASGGLNRVIATYAHTAGTGTVTLTKTFTANANDGASNTVNKGGLFATSSGGALIFEDPMPSPPTLVSGDSIAVTWTVTF